MEEIGQRRRSARISALSDTIKAQQATWEELDAFFENEEKEIMQMRIGASSGSEPEPGSKKTGRKKRKVMPVDQVLESSSVKSKEILTEEDNVNEQENQNSKPEKRPSINVVYVRRSTKPTEPEMPEKRLLRLVIDALQRRDSHEIFAEPVDTNEVKEYDKFVTEPMDFSTLKNKLEQGAYKSLQDFERDTLLIFRNAKVFNPPDSIFYKQARALNGYAKKIFHDLRTDPDNFDSEYSLTRRRPGRRPKCEAKSTSHTISRASYGTREARGSNACGARDTYTTYESCLSENESLISDIATCLKPLTLARQEEIGYRESILRFAEGMGPTVRRVVEKKLEQLQAQAQAQIAASSQSDRSKSPMNGIRDLNLPADGMTETGSFLSLGVNSSKSESDAKASKSTVASQARLLEIGGPSSTRNDSSGSLSLPLYANNSSGLPFQALNSSRSCSFPFQVKTALIPNQVPSSFVPGSGFQSQGLFSERLSYRESSSQQASSSVSRLSTQSPEGCRQTSRVLPSLRVHPTTAVPDSRYGASSSRAVPPPENLYNTVQSEGAVRLYRQSQGAIQTMARASQAPGATSSQGNASRICPPWNQQNIYFRDSSLLYENNPQALNAQIPIYGITNPTQPTSWFEWSQYNLPGFRNDSVRPPESAFNFFMKSDR